MPPAKLYQYTGNSDPLEKALFILQDAIVILNRKFIITYINKAGKQIFEGQLNFQPVIGTPKIRHPRYGRQEIRKEEKSDHRQ